MNVSVTHKSHPTQGAELTIAYTKKPTVRVYGFPDASGNFTGCLSDMLLALSKRLNFRISDGSIPKYFETFVEFPWILFYFQYLAMAMN